MGYDQTDFETTEGEELPEESSNNRTFLIAVGILGGIILLSIACLVGVYLFGTQNQQAQQAQSANATQTALANEIFIEQALTATAQASLIQPTATLEPTTTSVVAVASPTETPDPSETVVASLDEENVAATATVGAALTEAAIAQLTVVPTTTLLPQTGFVEDVGVPGLIVMALAFIIVILLARRLRAAPVR
jgi:multisubunit Na+/H+ antiporter MnhB subunit